MSLYSLDGLVIREIPYGEADKILHVLTAEYGKIPVYAKGVRSFKHRYRSCAQLMAYNEFVLYRKNEFYYLKEAATVENFYSVTQDLDSFALAQYCLEVASDVCVEGEEEGGMLRLLLNTLYLIAQGEKPLSQIKAVYELRTAQENGWMPALHACADCAAPLNQGFFDLPGGVVYCEACQKRFSNTVVPTDPLGFEGAGAFRSGVLKFVTPDVLALMRRILAADPKRIAAFSAPEPLLSELDSVCESYLLHQLERGFSTLDFYHSLHKYPKP